MLKSAYRTGLSSLLALCMILTGLAQGIEAQQISTPAEVTARIQELYTYNVYVRSAMQQLEARGWVFRIENSLRQVQDNVETLFITYDDGDSSTWEGVFYLQDSIANNVTAIAQSTTSTGEVMTFIALNAPNDGVTFGSQGSTLSAFGIPDWASGTFNLPIEPIIDLGLSEYEECVQQGNFECNRDFDNAQTNLIIAYGAGNVTCLGIGLGTVGIGGAACAGIVNFSIIAASRRNKSVHRACLQRVQQRCITKLPR